MAMQWPAVMVMDGAPNGAPRTVCMHARSPRQFASSWRETFEKLNSNPRLGGLHAGSHVEGGGVCSLLLSLSVLVMRQQAATRQWICFMVHRVCNKFKEMGMIMVVIGG